METDRGFVSISMKLLVIFVIPNRPNGFDKELWLARTICLLMGNLINVFF